LILTILFLEDERILLADLIDPREDVEGVHAMIVISGQAGAPHLPVDAHFKIIIERIHEGEEIGRAAVDQVESEVLGHQQNFPQVLRDCLALHVSI
jgi:hypothetical protein